jgi:uncharacterized membrane protein
MYNQQLAMKEDNIEFKPVIYLDKGVYVEERELESMLRGINEIKEVSLQINSLISVHNEHIDTIEDSIVASQISVEKAGAEINKALKNKKSSYNMGFGLTGGALTGLAFGGPIGLLIGAGVGGLSGGVATLMS